MDLFQESLTFGESKMNLEEARNNIGAEVELDESTKPYTFMHDDGNEHERISDTDDSKTYEIIDFDDFGNAILEISGYQISPRHLKLKPQNYKIHVPTEDESREAQELLFELGMYWFGSGKNVLYTDCPYLYTYSDDTLGFDRHIGKDNFESKENKQINLQELRDMVAKKKLESKCFDEAVGSNPLLKVKVECKEMTWQDALRAVADGKRVEFYNELCEQWWDISHLSATEVVRIEKFRLTPKRIYLNGNFTKEELLQKAGEME